MQAHILHFQRQYESSPLKLTIRPRGIFGASKKTFLAVPVSFSPAGVSMQCLKKLRVGKRVEVSIESHDHRLQAVPAVVTQVQQHDNLFTCELSFKLEQCSDLVSDCVNTVLNRIHVGQH